jgi:hypothetical protein
MLESRIPDGQLKNKWTNYKSSVPLVSPSNKRRLDVIVIGTGLAGASAASSMAEMGYNVKTFIQLQRKAGLTPQKIIRMTGILFIVFFMIPLKAGIIVPEKPMFIG